MYLAAQAALRLFDERQYRWVHARVTISINRTDTSSMRM